jgi:hypothetical protein
MDAKMRHVKNALKAFLEECVTPGTEAYEHYETNDWFSISRSILDFTSNTKIPLLAKKCDPYAKLSDSLDEFKSDYSSTKDFEQASKNIVELFKWPESRTECVYTKLPVPTEAYYDDLAAVTEELNKIPAHHFAEFEKGLLDSSVSIALMCKRPIGGKKADPLKALETFLLAYENGLYPPVWVLDYMADIFKTFHESAGMKSLDTLFGFNRKGRGGPFQKMTETQRDGIVCQNIWQLEHFFGIDRETACKLEANRLRNDKDINKTPLSFVTNLSWKTLEDRYRKKWAPLFTSVYAERDEAWRKKWVEDNGKAFLDQYPSFKKQKMLK